MQTLILLDIDNCVADDAHRLPLINLAHPENFERFRAYHDESWRDNARNHEQFQSRGDVVIVTSRPVEYQRVTTDWLNMNGIYPVASYFRGAGDVRGSVDIKREAAQDIQRRWPGAMLAAFDDRDDIIDMYRSMGIPATKLAINDHSELRGA